LPQDSLPFSSSYWPMGENGILARWMDSNSLSPAEKYGTLFLSTDQQKTMYAWIENNQGKNVPGVQEWFGICPGWAASALLEKPPKHPIQVRKAATGALENCEEGSSADCLKVTPGDITGLLAAVYNEGDARFIGQRCDTEVARFSYDSSGRIRMPNCRSNA